MDAPGPLQRNVIPVSRLLLLSNLPGGTFQNLVGTILQCHCRRNGSNLFQITVDTHPGVSGEKFKNTHCQVDYPAKIEEKQKNIKKCINFHQKLANGF